MTKKCRSLWLAVIFNAGGLRVGGSQTNADCRATRHRFMRGATSSFRYTARSITAGAQSETMLDVRRDPISSPHVFSCPSGLIANTIRVKTSRLCRAMTDWPLTSHARMRALPNQASKFRKLADSLFIAALGPRFIHKV